MRILNYALAAFVLANSMPAYGEAGTITFTPSSAWNVEFADDFCALRRVFQANDNRATLELRQYAPGEGFDLIFLAQGPRYQKREVAFRFLPHADRVEPDLVFGMEAADGYSGIFTTAAFGPPKPKSSLQGDERPSPSIESEASLWAKDVSKLEFDKGFNQTVVVETGPLKEAREVMQQCLMDLLGHWGIDAKAHQSAIRGPQPKGMMRWARKIHASYPAEALRNDIQGPVKIRMIIGMDGKPTSCRSMNSFTNEILHDASCDALLRHARFEPALDKDGKPMIGYYVTQVSYMLD